MTKQIHSFLSGWTAAEGTGDTETLARFLTEDFCGVGPLGFVLPKPAWLGRYHQGLAYEHFSLEEIQIRLYTEVALVIARTNARGTFQGRPLPEAARASLVIASHSGTPRLASIDLSFIAGAEVSPPVPAPPASAGSSADRHPNREGR